MAEVIREYSTYQWKKPEVVPQHQRAVQKKTRVLLDLIKTRDFEFACNSSEEQLTAGFTKYGLEETPYWFKDNGANVLAVAHLDSVCTPEHFKLVRIGKERMVFSPVLDDRAGVYVILFLLPAMGINVDVLFTTNEEMGASTAAEFVSNKKYNWIVEFDRAGTDVVLYDYDANNKWKVKLQEVGFVIGHGTFSDISELEDLKCCAVNVGVGSYDGHSIRARLVLEELAAQVAKFWVFYNLNRTTHFVHSPVARYKYRYNHDILGGYDKWDRDYKTKEDYTRIYTPNKGWADVMPDEWYHEEDAEAERKRLEEEELREWEEFVDTLEGDEKEEASAMKELIQRDKAAWMDGR